MSAPPGWYADPYGTAAQRWWDGTVWTAHSVAWPTASPTPAVAPPDRRIGVQTVWIWLLVALPVVQWLASIPYLVWVDDWLRNPFSALGMLDAQGPISPSRLYDLTGMLGPILIAQGLMLLIGAVAVLFGWLDWRELVRRGVPRPFHWAWSFLALLGYGLVYVIGRTVVARRRTGSGLAPIWVSIAIVAAGIVVGVVWASLLLASYMTGFGGMMATVGSFSGR